MTRAIKREVVTTSVILRREHDAAIRASEYARLVSLRNDNKSCHSCAHREQVFYSHRCTKKKKLISIHNICHHWEE